jgi:hypothetical protein
MCLRWAAELDRRGVANPKLPEAMTAIEQALRVIISFLGRRSSLPIDDVAPLLRLQAAIIDLANGRASPLFKPVKRRAGGSRLNGGEEGGRTSSC